MCRSCPWPGKREGERVRESETGRERESTRRQTVSFPRQGNETKRNESPRASCLPSAAPEQKESFPPRRPSPTASLALTLSGGWATAAPTTPFVPCSGPSSPPCLCPRLRVSSAGARPHLLPLPCRCLMVAIKQHHWIRAEAALHRRKGVASRLGRLRAEEG